MIAPVSRLLKARHWCENAHSKIDNAAGTVLGISGEDARRFDKRCASGIVSVGAFAVCANAITSLVDGHSIIRHLPGNFAASVILGPLLSRTLFDKSPAINKATPT